MSTIPRMYSFSREAGRQPDYAYCVEWIRDVQNAWVSFLLVIFLGASKEKSPARRRRVEALLFAAEAKALDSRLRGNDEPRRDGRSVSDPLAEGEWKLMLKKIETMTLDSRLRGNDEPRRDGRSVSDPLAASKWKLMLREIETKALDYARLLSRALRAIRCANVRSGILPLQSRLRGTDEPRVFAGTTTPGVTGEG